MRRTLTLFKHYKQKRELNWYHNFWIQTGAPSSRLNPIRVSDPTMSALPNNEVTRNSNDTGVIENLLPGRQGQSLKDNGRTMVFSENCRFF